MRKLISFFVVLGLALPTVALGGAPAKKARSPESLSFGAPIRYHNMTLVPVSTSKRGPFKRYTLFEAGIEGKTLKVRELAGKTTEAQVAAVEVKNIGKFDVFLLGGEMILGGKQDRIIQSDTVIPRDGKWRKVAVFCVEQGRWQGGNMRFGSGKSLAHSGLAKAALSGDQSKVWAEVGRKNKAHGTQNATQTYRRTIQNGNVRKRIAKFRNEIYSRLPADGQVAGLVFAVNGKIRVADLFGNPVLFKDIREKLVSSYILEALEHPVDKSAPELGASAAEGFMKTGRGAKRGGKKKSGGATNYSKKAPKMVGNESVDDNGDVVRESYHAE